jgi:DNA polymerase-1
MAFRLDIPPPAYVDTDEEVDRLLEEIPEWDMVGFDTETTGLDHFFDQIWFWSLANGHERYCLPRHRLWDFKEIFEDKSIKWAIHNANFDANMLANAGISQCDGSVVGNRYDSMILHTLFRDFEPHDLDHVSRRVLGIPKLFSYKERFGGVNIQELRPGHELFADMVDYASLDAWLHYMCVQELRIELEKERTVFGSLWDYYVEIDCPLQDVLFRIERRGVLVDIGYLKPKGRIARRIMDEAIGELTFANPNRKYINPGSTKQLGRLFYEDFGLPMEQKTSGGQSGIQKGSTSEDVLISWVEREEIRIKDPDDEDETFVIPEAVKTCVRAILKYRKHQKLKSTYIDGLTDRVNSNTGRVHGQMTQHIARTGRLSHRNPNLANIPRKENDPYGIRSAFVPEIGATLEEDWVMLVADYSQVEMMLAASNCGDENMLEAIHSGKDLHCNTAALMFGIPYDELVDTKRKKDAGLDLNGQEKDLVLKRQQAKTIGFGVLYGEGPMKLAEQLGISIREAASLQARFFSAFPTLKAHIEEIEEETQETDAACTALGRRRRLPNASSPHSRREYYEALRQAFNFTIQGFASEIVKVAMVAIGRDPDFELWDCHMLMQIHDEIVCEVPPWNADKAATRLRMHMEAACAEYISVDLVAEVGRGNSWQEAK